MKLKNKSGILSTRIDPELKDAFNEVCRKMGLLPRQEERKLIEPAFRKFIKKAGKEGKHEK